MATSDHTKTNARTKLVTAEQLYKLPDDPFNELYDGVLMVREASGVLSSNIATELAITLGLHVRTYALGRIFAADLHCILSRNPDTVLAPDLSFVARTRLIYGQNWEKFLEGAPDLAVEVLSPSNRLAAQQRKVQRYLAAGTSLAWIIQPRTRSAYVYRKDGTTSYVPSDGMLDGEDVVPDFRCALASLFVL